MEDRELVRMIRENPSKGLHLCMEKYGDTVQWIIRKILNGFSEQDIEECMSDVFFALWKNIDSYEEKEGRKISSYLYGIARNIAISCLRKNAKRLQELNIEEENLEIQIDFEEEYNKKVNKKIVQKAIDELPYPDREIFIYRYYFMMKISEIAICLEINPKQVENKLCRGKKKLRKVLQRDGIILD